jgi:flagellar protein FliJ
MLRGALIRIDMRGTIRQKAVHGESGKCQRAFSSPVGNEECHQAGHPMRRFHFRLERVLRLKQQRQRLAELRLQEARLKLEAAQAQVATLHEELARVAREWQARIRGPLASGAWLAAAAQSARLSKALQEAAARVEKAAQEVREAAALRVQRTAEAEALLHLRDHAWQAHQEEAASNEQRRLDELSLRQWESDRGQGMSADPTPGGAER